MDTLTSTGPTLVFCLESECDYGSKMRGLEPEPSVRFSGLEVCESKL